MIGLSRKYEAVSGFCLQDSPTAIPTDIGPTSEFFGLVSESWRDFKARINRLCFKLGWLWTVSYKVLFLQRHGEGYHNVGMARYSQEDWDGGWSTLNGDGDITWGPDPRLTDTGEEQAREARAAWQRELSRDVPVPVPQRFYCSPLTRAIRTFELTFENLLPEPPRTVILENCREEYGLHTCDRRRRRSELQNEFPNIDFEEGFEEQDELWTPEEHENRASVERRAKLVLDRIFQNDHDATYISITSHSGWTNAFLRVVGRDNYALPTGGILVVVIKGKVSYARSIKNMFCSLFHTFRARFFS